MTEIAPGISIEKDILPQMDFVPEVSPSCSVMLPRYFA